MNKQTIEALVSAPCLCCGYNGAGFFQSGTHDKDCRWYSIGGMEERKKQLTHRPYTEDTE